ncbi:MAG: type IV pilus twitching motility protein PilT [Planctomycetota bacterium]
MVTLDELLRMLIERNGSDLHIAAGSSPRIRSHGELIETQHDPLTAEETQKIVYSILDSDQIARFEDILDLDMSFGIAGIGRFRTNVFMQRGAVGAAIRLIPYEIMNFEALSLPRRLCETLCLLPRGLILVTGSTGSGKSTTLAAMIDFINGNESGHILTIEDPIEFVHQNKKCLVNQREIGTDSKSFHNALRSVLRQDPDYVLIGEMRDMETIEMGLTLAETGHLTFATLHTSDAIQTINRIIDVFPSSQQGQIRTQLSFVLEGVFCQQLLAMAGGKKGRVLAYESMVPNDAIRALIRDDKSHQVYSMMQTNLKSGNKTMNMCLSELVKVGKIDAATAMSASSRPEELGKLIHG